MIRPLHGLPDGHVALQEFFGFAFKMEITLGKVGMREPMQRLCQLRVRFAVALLYQRHDILCGSDGLVAFLVSVEPMKGSASRLDVRNHVRRNRSD